MVSRLARQGINPRTVIDIGANVGQFAVASAMLLPDSQVYSFEPGPKIVSQLMKNVTSLSNVRVFPYALGEKGGVVEFHMNQYSPSSSLLRLAQSHKTAFPGAQEKEIVQAEMTTLDEIAVGLELNSPFLMKIDVQGYEMNSLVGAKETLKQVDYVIVETSFEPMYEGEKMFREILDLLETQGFCFARPLDFSSDERISKILQMDALFIRRSNINPTIGCGGKK
jgi:FkbM family methyltransferase